MESQRMESQRGMKPSSRLVEPEPLELRDGTQVSVRPIRTEDAPRLQSLFGRLSRESIYYRFLEFRKELTAEQARRLSALDHDKQMALVATSEQESHELVIGVARYAVIPGSQPREAEAAIVPELASALTRMLAAVLVGMSRDQAQQALGEQQQLVQQAQQRVEQSRQRSIDELQKLLTDQQKDALVWFNSPARALDGAVNAVAQARGAQDAQWSQFRTQVSQALSRMSSQVNPEGGASVETISGLLDQVRAMDDATFEAKRATLAGEWLPTLMPNMAQMLQNPQFRQERLRQACERLITYERGSVLIQAKRDAMATE